MWTDFFSGIFVLNLTKRTDRLLECAEELEKYNIPYQRVSAIENENGANGLLQTMQKLFEDCIEQGLQNILVFEDDVLFVQDPTLVMDNVVKQLPEKYDMVLLGGQIKGFSYPHSENLLGLVGGWSTHAVIYSLQGMKDILALGMTAPIDNFFVDKIHNRGYSYCVRPLLATQREGFSDICKNEINWQPFITKSYNEKLRLI